MKKRVVQSVYNLTISELQRIVSSILPYEGEITLSPSLLGGWSSLNFLGLDNDIPRFIVKISSTLDGSDFKKLYSIHDTLSQYGICSKPLGRGYIENDPKIPFLLLEYEEGVLYSDPNDIRGHLFDQLNETLERLSHIDISFVNKYQDANEYVSYLMSPLERKYTKWKKKLESELANLLEQFLSNVKIVHEIIDRMNWDPVTIHGDLYERNIVFQENKVSLLDLEECCVADRFYDLAYLFTQSYTTSRIKDNHFGKKGISIDHWQNLELIALVSVISWSFNWLIDSAFENVEPNLVASVGRTTVVDYLETKMKLLSSLLI